MTVNNLSASVHARLQNHARATKRPFQELLQYYAMERFLYRLSKSPYRTHFVLKGALLLHVWDAPLARATKDLDFLGRLNNSLENLERVVREVCAADVEPDGLVFGDVVTPGEESISYPTLLDFPAPEISGYPRETVVAEKFQAMIYLRSSASGGMRTAQVSTRRRAGTWSTSRRSRPARCARSARSAGSRSGR